MTDLPVVIFMTSNGVGMGHLSRQLTVALSGPSRFDSVIFSLSGALPRIMNADRGGELPEARSRGLRYEFCPSRESGWLPPGGWQRQLRSHYQSYRWHPYLRDRLAALATETGAGAIVFDGVVPYAGLLAARRALPEVKFIWMRRGMWQSGAVTTRLRHSDDFDLVIEPGDFGSAADRGLLAQRSDATHVAPISMVDILTLNDRKQARAALGLPPDRPAVLLAPGSGALGSIEETAARILAEVARIGPQWVIAVTRQSIAQHQIGAGATSVARDSIVVLDDVYPLARHLSAFDAAVSAAGYNSVHELLASGIPTLLVPSVHHATDDQGARARGVADRGAALLPDGEQLERAVRRLLRDDVREGLRQRCGALETVDGGAQAAELVDDLLDAAAPSRRAANLPARGSLARPPWVDARTPVTVQGPSRLRFTDTISVADVRSQVPVEHLIEGSSVAYRAARTQGASWLYRPQAQARAD